MFAGGELQPAIEVAAVDQRRDVFQQQLIRGERQFAAHLLHGEASGGQFGNADVASQVERLEPVQVKFAVAVKQAHTIAGGFGQIAVQVEFAQAEADIVQGGDKTVLFAGKVKALSVDGSVESGRHMLAAQVGNQFALGGGLELAARQQRGGQGGIGFQWAQTDGFPIVQGDRGLQVGGEGVFARGFPAHGPGELAGGEGLPASGDVAELAGETVIGALVVQRGVEFQCGGMKAILAQRQIGAGHARGDGHRGFAAAQGSVQGFGGQLARYRVDAYGAGQFGAAVAQSGQQTVGAEFEVVQGELFVSHVQRAFQHHAGLMFTAFQQARHAELGVAEHAAGFQCALVQAELAFEYLVVQLNVQVGQLQPVKLDRHRQPGFACQQVGKVPVAFAVTLQIQLHTVQFDGVDDFIALKQGQPGQAHFGAAQDQKWGIAVGFAQAELFDLDARAGKNGRGNRAREGELTAIGLQGVA